MSTIKYFGGKGRDKYMQEIKQYLNAVRNGAWQEEISIQVIDFRGICNYSCCNIFGRADKAVLLTRFVGKRMKAKQEITPFHSRCLEKLLNDKRLEGMN